MTRQIEDLIEITGEQRRLRAWPLEDYWKMSRKPRPAFPPLGSNCHRRYRVHWLVRGDQLFLQSISAGSVSVEHHGRVQLDLFIQDYLDEVFPGAGEVVPADWVSGEFYTETMDKTKAEMLSFAKGRLLAQCACTPFDPHAEYRRRMQEIMEQYSR